MKIKTPFIVFFIFLVIGIGCNKKEQKTSTYINTELWKNELINCKGYRKERVQNLDSLRKQIFSLTEEELNEILGRPEQTLLYERGQKFYEYRINCTTSEIEEYLRIRINALGYVNEVLLLEK